MAKLLELEAMFAKALPLIPFESRLAHHFASTAILPKMYNVVDGLIENLIRPPLLELYQEVFNAKKTPEVMANEGMELLCNYSVQVQNNTEAAVNHLTRLRAEIDLLKAPTTPETVQRDYQHLISFITDKDPMCLPAAAAALRKIQFQVDSESPIKSARDELIRERVTNLVAEFKVQYPGILEGSDPISWVDSVTKFLTNKVHGCSPSDVQNWMKQIQQMTNPPHRGKKLTQFLKSILAKHLVPLQGGVVTDQEMLLFNRFRAFFEERVAIFRTGRDLEEAIPKAAIAKTYAKFFEKKAQPCYLQKLKASFFKEDWSVEDFRREMFLTPAVDIELHVRSSATAAAASASAASASP